MFTTFANPPESYFLSQNSSSVRKDDQFCGLFRIYIYIIYIYTHTYTYATPPTMDPHHGTLETPRCSMRNLDETGPLMYGKKSLTFSEGERSGTSWQGLSILLLKQLGWFGNVHFPKFLFGWSQSIPNFYIWMIWKFWDPHFFVFLLSFLELQVKRMEFRGLPSAQPLWRWPRKTTVRVLLCWRRGGTR